MSTYEISKSSLLSLKAEILRKQDELTKAKAQNENKKVEHRKLKPLEVKNKGLEQRELNDFNEEDENLFVKSRAALEAKARLYESLSRRANFTDAEIERNRRYLVRFDRKSRVGDLPPEEEEGEIDVNHYPESDEERYYSDEYEAPKNPDEEWVEYTDCLGRTRKCMRKDLDFVKSKDAELKAAVDKDENKAEQLSSTGSCVREINENKVTESSELLSSDMRRELLRQQWEKEEEELRKKDDLHYQDILFNEARTHGVGYYGFSKDEEERAKQQDALKNLRHETQQEQEKAKEMRNLREKQLAARAKAARNRKRARMGLPPEEDVPEPTPPVEENKPNEEQQELQEQQQKVEKLKDAARKKHIRPWDIGKKGIKEHYEYSQEEWVDKKRKERPTDFAPPTSYKTDLSERHRPEKRKDSLYFSTKKDRRRSESDEDEINPYKSADFKQTLITNEWEEESEEESDHLLRDYEQRKGADQNESVRGKRTEIPPPPTFDYYGPSGTKKSKSDFNKGNLADSISAGLQFLRQQSEKKDSSKKHPTEMFLF